MKTVSILLLLLVWRLTGANAQNYNLMSTETSDVASTVPVEYSCVFRNLWTSARHPVAYPPGGTTLPDSAHWSSMVLVAHSQDYTMWKEGQLASQGVENVAEVSERLLRVHFRCVLPNSLMANNTTTLQHYHVFFFLEGQRYYDK
jgi:hypothetical protein